MMTKRLLFAVVALAFACGLTACERNQEQLTPAAKTEEGRKSAQEYPSTRNMENPDPSIGGDNSASSRPETNAGSSGSGSASDQSTGH